MAFPDSSSTSTVDTKPAAKKPAAKKASKPKEKEKASSSIGSTVTKQNPLSGVVQGGREVTHRELNTGVSRQPDDPLEAGKDHEKHQERLKQILKDLTELREDAYNAGNKVVAQIAKGAERELRVSSVGYVRFSED